MQQQHALVGSVCVHDSVGGFPLALDQRASRPTMTASSGAEAKGAEPSRSMVVLPPVPGSAVPVAHAPTLHKPLSQSLPDEQEQAVIRQGAAGGASAHAPAVHEPLLQSMPDEQGQEVVRQVSVVGPAHAPALHMPLSHSTPAPQVHPRVRQAGKVGVSVQQEASVHTKPHEVMSPASRFVVPSGQSSV